MRSVYAIIQDKSLFDMLVRETVCCAVFKKKRDLNVFLFFRTSVNESFWCQTNVCVVTSVHYYEQYIAKIFVIFFEFLSIFLLMA